MIVSLGTLLFIYSISLECSLGFDKFLFGDRRKNSFNFVAIHETVKVVLSLYSCSGNLFEFCELF